MTPRSGIALLFVFSAAAIGAIGGCSNYASTTTPTPVSSVSPSPFPDTLYVQDTTSRSIRVYKNASGSNGFSSSSAQLSAPTTAFVDVVYNPAKDVLWVPFCAGAPCPGTSGPVDVWAAASTLKNGGPTSSVTLPNINGAAAYDETHDLLFVTVNNAPIVQIYSSASTLGTGGNTVPATSATLQINDPQIQYSPPPPRPQELYYDKARDLLFASDYGTVVAEFDNFGAQAAAAAASHTPLTLPPSREITALVKTDGMAYNSAQDILFVVADQSGQLTVISQASVTNGPAGHAQLVTGFANAKGVAYDDVRNILFVYDPGDPGGAGEILSYPNATTLAGNQAGWAGRKAFVDAFVSGLSGFGISIDTTH